MGIMVPDEVFYGTVPPPSPPPVAPTPPPPTVAPTPTPPPVDSRPIVPVGGALIESEPNVYIVPLPVSGIGGTAPPPPSPPAVDTPTSGTPETRIITRTGVAYVESEPGVIFAAPPKTDDGTVVVEPPGIDVTDLSRGLDSAKVLRGQAFVDYIRGGCAARKLDDLAVFADIFGEGISGAIGDGGLAYGPFQDHLTEFEGRPWYGHGRNNHAVNVWAWTAKGIDYSLNRIATTSAKGKAGADAVAAIVREYEIPGDIAGAISLRTSYYYGFAGNKTKAYALIASKANGPTDQGGVDDSTDSGSGTPGRAANSAGPYEQWRGLVNVFRTKVPQAHNHVKALADSLTGVFR